MLQIGGIYKYKFTNDITIVYMLVTYFNNKIITGIMFDFNYEFDSMFTIDIRDKERMKKVGNIFDKKGLGIKLYNRGNKYISKNIDKKNNVAVYGYFGEDK